MHLLKFLSLGITTNTEYVCLLVWLLHTEYVKYVENRIRLSACLIIFTKG